MTRIPDNNTIPGARLPGFIRLALGSSGLWIGGIILLIIILIALSADIIIPGDPLVQDIGNRLKPPVWHEKGTWEHMLGTDKFGRDYLGYLIYGSRTTLVIGFVPALMAALIGTILGITSGYYGGRVDTLITYAVTVRLAMPALLVALAVISIVGSSMTVLILVLGLTFWDRFAVVMRTATKQVCVNDYITVAKQQGCSFFQIFTREIFPNVMGHFVVIFSLEAANCILAGAALSFLGLGVKPPTPSWGLMISEGKKYMFFSPWLIAIPGLALAILVLAINLFGDGLRETLVPDSDRTIEEPG